MMEKQIPVMQQPGYVFWARKYVRARRLLRGDRIAEGPRTSSDPYWTVASIEEKNGLIYVTYANGRCHAIGAPTDRVYVDRAEK
jgi:hypothetical protein